MKIKAYAKVNLCLKIFKTIKGPKHKLDSIFYLIKKIHDTIYIRKSKKLKIQYFYKNKKIEVENCLIMRTMNYLKQKLNLDINYNIRIKKNIPIGAGMGGGSSDAAAIINFLIKNKNINLDLEEIAINLGSDIPFFLTNYSIARVREYGQYVTPICDYHPKIKLNINYIFVKSEQIFKLLDNDRYYKSQVNVDTFIKNYIYKQHLNVVYNDLTKYIIQSDKQLEMLHKTFDNHTWFTGAGSTIVTMKE